MNATESPSPGPRWRPLDRNERRVVGVLAEKAKTTPENYPLSLNAIINGGNQKSNRFPQMQLSEDQASDALDTLRHAGAVALIQGDGRVEKFRHLLYDWLGVDKAELAVMTELLLRGAQTLGELRGRAARMEPIRDMGELMPIVDGLRQKNLVIYLSPPGRGAVVTHNLYQPQELAKLKTEHAGEGHADARSAECAAEGSYYPPPVAGPVAKPSSAVGPEVTNHAPAGVAMDELRAEVAELRDELAQLRQEFADLTQRLLG
jgi:uncharacterized protein